MRKIKRKRRIPQEDKSKENVSADLLADHPIGIPEPVGPPYILEHRPTQINVSYSYTTNKGNYESEKIQMGIARDLKLNENVNDALEEELEFLYKIVTDAFGSQ